MNNNHFQNYIKEYLAIDLIPIRCKNFDSNVDRSVAMEKIIDIYLEKCEGGCNFQCSSNAVVHCFFHCNNAFIHFSVKIWYLEIYCERKILFYGWKIKILKIIN